MLTDADAHPPPRPRGQRATTTCIGVIAWMHTFSPAKMWIAGLDALRKPLLHLHTQANVELPWADIDFDFMNLNQAAHGDREFGYIQTRLGVARKTVVGHVSDPACSAGRGLGAGRRRLGRSPVAEARPLRRQHALRRRDRGRQDRGRAALRRPGQHLGRQRAGRRRRRRPPTPDVDALVAEYEDRYDVAAGAAARAVSGTQSLRDGAAIELGLRSFLEAGGFGAFTTSFEDLGALQQLPGLAVQRLMADGYGFGAEGDWKTAILVRVAKVMGAGLPGGASLMEDYTYDLVPGAGADPRRAHARGRPVADHGQAPPGDPPAGHRRQGGPGAPRLHRRPRPRASSSRCPTCATGSGWSPTSSRTSRRRTCRTCRSAAPSGSRSPTSPPPPPPGSPPAPHTTPSCPPRSASRCSRDFAEMARTELLVIDESTTVGAFRHELRWNQAYYRLAQGL